MNRSSAYQDRWNELVSLLWCAIGQGHTNEGMIDEDTYRFFTTTTTAITTPRSYQPQAERQSRTDPHLQHKALEDRCSHGELSPSSQKMTSAPNPEEEEPMDANVDSPEPKFKRHLEKLLPRPFSSQPVDVTSTRKQLSSSTSIPHLSSVPLYENPPSHPAKNHWTIFAYLPSSSPPSPKETFINSVVKALDERLNIHLSLYSCYDSSFALHLPIAVDDSDVVLFFVDSHLKSSLDTLLETVQTFTTSSQPIETPFSLLGTVHGRPLRAFILHASTHEDQSIKGALWHSLKTLATLTPPQ